MQNFHSFLFCEHSFLFLYYAFALHLLCSTLTLHCLTFAFAYYLNSNSIHAICISESSSSWASRQCITIISFTIFTDLNSSHSLQTIFLFHSCYSYVLFFHLLHVIFISNIAFLFVFCHDFYFYIFLYNIQFKYYTF